MKANIETLEPTIRPGTAPKAVAAPARSFGRSFNLRPVAAPALFHAWRP